MSLFNDSGMASIVGFKFRVVLAYLRAFNSTLLLGARDAVTALPVHSCAGCSMVRE